MRSVAAGGVEQMSNLQARWDKFELMMQSHQLMVKEQVLRVPYMLFSLNCKLLICRHISLTLQRAEVSTGYTLPSRSNLHF